MSLTCPRCSLPTTRGLELAWDVFMRITFGKRVMGNSMTLPTLDITARFAEKFPQSDNQGVGNKKRAKAVVYMARKNSSTDVSIDEKRFETTVLVHLDAAYNLAHWLTRDERDAEDVVQEACLRAFKFLETFRGGNTRAWFLTIVRNTFYSGLKKNRSQALNVPFDEESSEAEDVAAHVEWAWNDGEDVASDLEREEAKRLVNEALDRLPEEFREIIVLRELEELSYQDIARIAQIPLGTVMSRLSRARKLLYEALRESRQES